MANKLTGFERMWNAYPAPAGNTEEAKKMIGGEVDAAWLSNTCTVRVSRCMNYGGHPVPAGLPSLTTVRGADNLRYAIRVEEMRKWLTSAYGPPLSEDRDPPRDEAPASFAGKTGIICFRVKIWEDATGHIDLWDSTACRHAQYFDVAYQVLLWPVAMSGAGKLDPGATPVTISASVGEGGQNKAADVARVQALLDARGYEIGPADGIAGPSTLQAIRDLQSRFLGTPDGRVEPGGRTWRELNGL